MKMETAFRLCIEYSLAPVNESEIDMKSSAELIHISVNLKNEISRIQLCSYHIMYPSHVTASL